MKSECSISGLRQSNHLQEAFSKSPKILRHPSVEQRSRYVDLTKPPLTSRGTIFHQSLKTKQLYLIAAISVVSMASLGFAAYLGNKYINPPIPMPPTVTCLNRTLTTLSQVFKLLTICSISLFIIDLSLARRLKYSIGEKAYLKRGERGLPLCKYQMVQGQFLLLWSALGGCITFREAISGSWKIYRTGFKNLFLTAIGYQMHL